MRLYQAIILSFLSLCIATNLYAAEPKANKIRTDTTNFNESLSSSDINVQLALDSIDDAIAGTSNAWQRDSDGNLMPVEGTFITIFWEPDANDDLMPVN